MKKLLIILLAVILTGCATGSAIREKVTGEQFDQPKIESDKFFNRPENQVEPPEGGPVPVAVYQFTDKTGQRKELPNIASFSTAVTQGAEGYLISALQEVGNGRWFKVLERVG